MDNRAIAHLLRETADLMEIAGEDVFRTRSYRKAADAVEGCPAPMASMAAEPQRILQLPGIGKGMLANIQEILRDGQLHLHQELLRKYRPGMLELLNIQGLGPKTIALIWEKFQVASVDEVEQLAKEGKLRDLPRMGAKAEEKILRGIQSYRSVSGRFLRSEAEAIAEAILATLRPLPGVSSALAAGSLRRGKETVGDIDLLVSGPELPSGGQHVVEAFLRFPAIVETLVSGPNKVSIRLHRGPQVDLRLLPESSAGAALQYFTGSKEHNVALRQRALRRGMTLNEYGLFRLRDGAAAGEPGELVAARTEEEIYAALDLTCIPPELREDCGELEAAATGQLPDLIRADQIRGDIHMHTVETDGRATIEEMAAAARERGYEYIAITDHSQALAMANGLNEERALAHLQRIRAAESRLRQQSNWENFRIFSGIEVDILADGHLDLDSEVLAQLDIVIASVHSRFDQEAESMTARLLRAVEHPCVRLLGHPTGRLLLRREPYAFDVEAVVKACARHGVAMELNASPERLDLKDQHLRLCRQHGVKIIINTDAHHPRHLDNIRFGIATARRGWLTAGDVLNTRSAADLERALRPRS